MTQKEFKEEVRDKADELIEKFKPYVYYFLGSGMLTNTYSEEVAKINATKCVKILAQQILDLDVVWYRKEAIGKPDFIRPEMTREFWEEVMKELNK